MPPKRKQSKAIKDAEVVISSSLLDPQPVKKGTQVELWGSLPIEVDNEGEGLMELATGGKLDFNMEYTIHEGTLLPNLSQFSVAAVSVGGAHVVFIGPMGQAMVYGRNDHGQLGLGDFDPREEPTPVQLPSAHSAGPEAWFSSSSGRSSYMPKGSMFGRNLSYSGLAKSPIGESVLGRRLRASSCSADENTAPTPKDYDQENSPWAIAAVACGRSHTVFLGRDTKAASPCGQLFLCGAAEMLGLGDHTRENQPRPIPLAQPCNVTAIAAHANCSCCSASMCDSVEEARHLIYLWGEVNCCTCPNFFVEPNPSFRLPEAIAGVELGGSFGLARDIAGEIYAWGDSTYGELGGADVTVIDDAGVFAASHSIGDIRLPGKIMHPNQNPGIGNGRDQEQCAKSRGSAASASDLALESGALGVETSSLDSSESPPRWVDMACGERHALLLDNMGRVFAFGENLSGQCGVSEAVGAGHVTGSVVPKPRQVPVDEAPQPSNCCERSYTAGARVFAGQRHSALVTQDHRLYIWGHPANRKLGHAGFNPDGTEAGEDPLRRGVDYKCRASPPGVAVRSALRDAVRRPRLVYSQLHKQVRMVGLGEECTIIVTGDGDLLAESTTVSISPLKQGMELSPQEIGICVEGF